MIKKQYKRLFQDKKENWWQKVKAALLGPFFGLKGDPKYPHLRETPAPQMEIKFPEDPSSFKEWIQAIEMLTPLIQSVRRHFEPQVLYEMDVESLGISTYLLNLDRLLVKIREHLLNYRSQQEKYGELLESKYKEIKACAHHCYQTILNLTLLIQKLPFKKLYSDEFINQIHALELETTALSSAMANLYEYGSAAPSVLSSSPPYHVGQPPHYLYYSTADYLRSKIIDVPLEHQAFVSGIIHIYEMLRRCYIIARKTVVKETLETMSLNIGSLMVALGETEKRMVFESLNQIFHCIESIRFCTNRESRCSRNLFDKAKQAKHEIRKLCLKDPIGEEFLRKIELKRFSLIKKPPPPKSRNKF